MIRLLYRNEDGELDFKEHDLETDVGYAIISHMLSPTHEVDEVTFMDIKSKTGKEKPGYQKLLLCEKWAESDGLKYFWYDTCCADKTDVFDLSCAITDMFKWYENSQ